jgi:hypothetical protein
MHVLTSRLLITTLIALAFVASVSAAAPELIVEIEKQDIYEGESVLYRVTLNHVENPTAPELDGFDAFQVTTLGEQSLDSRQITIINGRSSEIIQRGRQYNYRLTPRRSGTFTIPAPTADVDGKVLTGRTITLKVSPPDEQDTVILEFASDRSSVYPMQPFELSLTIAVKDLPGDASDQDPLSVQPQPPALSVDWLNDERLPDGIEAEKSWREILEPLISRRGNGFQINNVGTSSVFSLFGNDAAGFHPKPDRKTRKDSSGQETGYWEYRFSRKLIPRRIGEYQFGPVTLKGTFADGIENDRLVGRTLYARALGLGVNVKDVPLTDRPDSYIGAVGSFEVNAQLAPTTARVGDPMTLTLVISGQGTLDDVRPPELVRLPGIENAFRTYEATEESTEDSRRFTYSLRPLSTDVTEFPSVAVSFFDVSAEKYVTSHTTPIPVTIEEAETLSNSDIVSAPMNSATPGELEASEGGVFANDSNLSSLRNEAIRPGRWGVAWGVMIAGWAAASLAIRRVRRMREDPALQRRRSAAARARSALDGSALETCESLQRAVTGLIADFADVPEAGLTPKDAIARLKFLGVDESLLTATQAFLHDCDAARYGAAPDDVARLKTEAAKLVEQLIVELRKSAATSSSRRFTSATLILFGFLAGGCSVAPDLETSRQFQDAEQRYSQATSPDDFSRVARQYDQIGNRDFVSGAVLYNAGNAWMRAGHVGHALALYRQAQRYRPRDPYLAANLQNALAASGRTAAPSDGDGLAGYVFFWQNWLSYPEKFATTTVLLAVTLLTSLISQLTTSRILMRRLSIIVALFCLLSASSTAWDWHRFTQTTHGVVTADQAIARKGNSENYEAAFTDPLPAGTECIVLEERADWLRLQFGEAGTGWLPDRSVVTY